MGGEDTKNVKLTIESKPPEKSPYQKVYSVVVDKFKQLLPEKKENGQFKSKTMGRGTLSIEKAEFSGKSIVLFVFRNSIGKTLYSGKFETNHSRKRIIEEKASKNQLKVRFLSLKADPETKKFKLDDCIISFTRSDDLKRFSTEFDDIVKTLKN